MTTLHAGSSDVLQSFLIDHSHIRGQFVRLSTHADAILQRHDYPDAVSALLAEMLVVVAMLSSNLKSEGVLTLQASGNGPVRFIVADATESGNVRGYADMDEARLADLQTLNDGATLKDILGEGHLTLTLDQGEGDGRYQGIVELEGESVGDAIRHYFTQSQQVEMALKLTVQKIKNSWNAAGIMIERLPEQLGEAVEEKTDTYNAAGDLETDVEEQWRRIHIFMESVADRELLDAKLSGYGLLERLFNEDGVWAYPPRSLSADCRCSRERIQGALSTIPLEELREVMENGAVEVNCQFCNKTESFSEAELGQIQNR